VLLLRKIAETDDDARKLLARIDGDLQNDEVLAEVVAELRNSSAAKAAEEEARRWAAKAVEAISILPEGSVKQALVTFANAVVDRSN
jgi:heptaprenyl diphosphate synthase